MIVYLVVFSIILIGAIYIERNGGPRLRKKWLQLEWLLLVLLAGLRYKVGGDTQGYYDEFLQRPSLFNLTLYDLFNSGHNFLWELMTSTCKTLYNDFSFFQIIHAIIVNTAVITFFKKYSNRMFLAVLIYFLLFYIRLNMEILRASLAVSVFLWSYKYLETKQWRKYILMSFIALGFHSEAIVLFVFPFLHKLGEIKITFNNILIIVAVTLLLMTVNFIPFLQNVTSASSSMSSSVEFYADQYGFGEGISILGYLKTFVINQIWLVFLLLLKDPKYSLLRGFSIFGFFISMQSLNYSTIFYRMQDFTNILLVVCICLSLECIRGKKLYIHKCIIYFSLLIMCVDYMLYLASHFILYYPYSSVFDPVDYYEREQYFYSIFHQD